MLAFRGDLRWGDGWVSAKWNTDVYVGWTRSVFLCTSSWIITENGFQSASQMLFKKMLNSCKVCIKYILYSSVNSKMIYISSHNSFSIKFERLALIAPLIHFYIITTHNSHYSKTEKSEHKGFLTSNFTSSEEKNVFCLLHSSKFSKWLIY